VTISLAVPLSTRRLGHFAYAGIGDRARQYWPVVFSEYNIDKVKYNIDIINIMI
jgi:hypothetical protein